MSGILLVLIPWGIDFKTMGMLLILATGLSLLYSEFFMRRKALQRYVPWPLSLAEDAVCTIVKACERPNVRPMKGAMTFGLGIGASMILFAPQIATLSIVALSIGDSVSTLVGVHHGTHKLPRFISNHKSWEGTAAMFFSVLGVSYFFAPIGLAIAAAFVSSLVEAFDFPIDDNVTIPIVTGAALALL